MEVNYKQLTPWLIFLIALTLRIVFLTQTLDNPTFFTPIVDAGNYHQMAQELAENSFLTEGFFWQPFFYPFFMAFIYMSFGVSIFAVKIIQIVVGSLTCVSIYHLGAKFFQNRIGILAGIILAFYGPAIFFDGELVGASLGAFLGVILLYLFLSAEKRPNIRYFFGCGFIGGLAILTRSTFLPFFLGASIFLLFFRLKELKRRLILGLFILLGLGLVVTPLSFLNAKFREGNWGFLPFSGGLNLYIGNNPDLCQTLTIRPGSEWEQLISLPKKFGYKHPWEMDSFFRKRFFKYLGEHPFHFLTGLGKKAIRLVNSREIPRNINLYIYRQWSSLLSLLIWKIRGFGFPFGALLPLAVIGAWFYRRELPFLLRMFVYIHSISLILVFIAARYRLELIPSVILLAALGIEGLRTKFKFYNWRKKIIVLIVIGCLVFISSLPGPFCEEKLNYEAELYYFVGLQQLKRGELDEAEKYFQHSLKLNSHQIDCLIALADVHFRKGDYNKAFQEYRRILEINPENVKALRKMGMALSIKGDLAEADRIFRLALRYDPYQESVYVLLGEIKFSQARLKEAKDLFKKSLAQGVRGKNKGLATLRLAQFAWDKGNLQTVEDYLKAGLSADPDNYYLLLSLAWLRVSSPEDEQRNVQEAQQLWKKAIQLKGVSIETNLVLAGIYAELGEVERAKEIAKHLVDFSKDVKRNSLEKDIRNIWEFLLANKKIVTLEPPFWLKLFMK